MPAPSKIISLRIPNELLDEIERAAAKGATTRTAEILRRLDREAVAGIIGSVSQGAGKRTSAAPAVVHVEPQAGCRHGRVIRIMGGLRCADCRRNL